MYDWLEFITPLKLGCHPRQFYLSTYVPEVLAGVVFFVAILRSSNDNSWLRKASKSTSNSCKGDVHRLEEDAGLYRLWKSPIQALH